MGFNISNRRRFADLTEQEVLALAISSEEDDARIYRSFAQGLRAEYPSGSAAVFDEMAVEEDGHRQRLIDLHVQRVRLGYSVDPARACGGVLCAASDLADGKSGAGAHP